MLFTNSQATALVLILKTSSFWWYSFCSSWPIYPLGFLMANRMLGLDFCWPTDLSGSPWTNQIKSCRDALLTHLNPNQTWSKIPIRPEVKNLFLMIFFLFFFANLSFGIFLGQFIFWVSCGISLLPNPLGSCLPIYSLGSCLS